jgi:hypothetical protein
LLYDLESDVNLEQMALISPTPGDIPEGVVLGETEPFALIAAGAGKQRLYLTPSLNAVVVRLGNQDRDYSDLEFLRLIVEGIEASS